MKSYNRDRLITIQRPTYIQNSTGEKETSWVNVGNPTWAEYKPMTGREYYKSDHEIANAVAIFNIGYRSGLNETMRILFNDDIYNIRYAREIGRQEALEITAEIVRRV